MAGFDGTEVSPELKSLIHDYHLGCVILFSKNIVDEKQLMNLTNDIQQEAKNAGYQYPILISIDQENGLVSRLAGLNFFMPGAMAIGATRSEKIAYEIGKQTAKRLKSLGINWNLAPVLDVNTHPNNPGVGTRSFSDDYELTARLASEFIKGHSSEFVLTSAKHFPGLGHVKVDPHFDLPKTDCTLNDLENGDLIPFKRAIASGVKSIMTAHVLLPNIDDSGLPATMSKIILQKILREKLNFEDVIVTDCLEMEAISRFYGIKKGAINALLAGADMLIVSHTYSKQLEVLDEIIRNVENGKIDLEMIEQKAKKIENLQKSVFKTRGEYVELSYKQQVDLYKQSVSLIKQNTKLNKNKKYICFVPENESRFVGEIANREVIINFQKVIENNLENYEFITYTDNDFVCKFNQLKDCKEDIIIGLLNNDCSDLNFDISLKNKINVISMRKPYIEERLYELANSWVLTYENSIIPLDLAVKSIFGIEQVYGKIPVKFYSKTK